MRASALAVPLPTVTLADSVRYAVSLLVREQLSGLIVVDERRRPVAVVPGTQVLRMSLELGYQEDAALARAVDEEHAESFWVDQGDRRLSDCLATRRPFAGAVTADATVVEVASAMARLHTPLIAVTDEDGRLAGGITLMRLLEQLRVTEPGR